MNKQLNKALKSLTSLLVMMILLGHSYSYANPDGGKKKRTTSQKIMLALLLDTSNSMDGLIDQAKSQLWTVVNELAAAKAEDGSRPEINIALFEYGNDGLPSAEGHIRMVVNLTDDLDEISEQLFKLTTNGGDEYCGQVIKKSIDKLAWGESEADLKMIFIAGNEPFTQGQINYEVACALAKDKDIVVNTIFCGTHGEGISTSWRRGAELTGGSYMSIEQDRKTVYIKTPYDEKIDKLNDSLNKTYLYYGRKGREYKEKQRVQDANAASYGQANKVTRAISKSSHVYKNSTWDLVDAMEDDEEVLDELKEENLPDEMKGMSKAQRKVYVQKQAASRKSIQKEIQNLSVKRKQFISERQAAQSKEGMLDDALIQAIKKQAKAKKLKLNP